MLALHGKQRLPSASGRGAKVSAGGYCTLRRDAGSQCRMRPGAICRAAMGHISGVRLALPHTNTEAWARSLGVTFRLKSGALSDPDAP
jgi:hypothetical protein